MNKTGRIIKQVSNDYTVEIDNELIVCKPRGKFRKMELSPLVGDFVVIDYDNKYILEIKKRKNELKKKKIANVDYALIVTSVQIPEFSSNLLDKLLVNIEYNNIEPIICFTKMDIIDESKQKEIGEYIDYYRKIGYRVYINTDDSLKDIFEGKVTVLTGQSGAGKSTLLNMLDRSLKLETNEVSIALGRGRHTTRHTELMSVRGGYIADTPGFSSLDFGQMTEADIRDNFIEFNKYRHNCEYADCMHVNEENCEIKKMVAENEILKSRYDNYLKFIKKG